ncbi:hypothetical protein B566_EDAN004750 [Ephemera danica]|nr:hypothetical protein B566_EDAN004750 [Ephemera danica]
MRLLFRLIHAFKHHNLINKRDKSSISKIQSLVMEMKKDARPQRAKQKTKYAAANINLQVLGSGANGSSSSLYVFTDQSRYLFNCGEGTQRLAHEHKVKLSKLEHIFITHSSWKNLGGLPGMCLTLQDSGVSEVVLHGPPRVDDIFWATKRFIILRDLVVRKADQTEPFEDSVMKVDYAILTSNNTRQKSLDAAIVEESTEAKNCMKKRELEEPVEEGAAKKKLCLDAGECESISYICRLHPRPGTLQLELCEARGVPLGPLLGKLKAGEDVTLPNGTLVRSSDVTTPEEPGSIFIVVDCPDASYIPSLLSNPKFTVHQATATKDTDMAAVVIHFTSPEVASLPDYQEWINRFSPSTVHMMLNSGSKCQGTVAVHRIQYQLNLLHPTIFPLLHKTKELTTPCSTETLTIQGDTLDKFQLRPRRGLDKSNALVVNPQDYIDESMAEAGFKDELEKLRKVLNTNTTSTDEQVYPRVTFLGTGSCIPNKTRNTSGILLEIKEDQTVLLDCGESTIGQLIRLLGEEGSQRVLRSLQAVFVSHLHADHHIGLIYNETFEPIADQYKFVSLFELMKAEEECQQMEASLGLQSLRTVFVKHCAGAFGIALHHASGWKVVYSGDTEPCDALVEIGQDCDLLIHEATMEDGLEAEARKKRHSTTSEAIEIGQKMNAKFTLLTHFSQRYAKIPLFNDKFSGTVGIAFDNMRVSLSQLPLLPLLYPALRTMFNRTYEEMEQKTRSHQLKQERMARAVSSQ